MIHEFSSIYSFVYFIYTRDIDNVDAILFSSARKPINILERKVNIIVHPLLVLG